MICLSASDIYNYYRPSKCGGRVYLHHKGEAESPPGPYEEVLQRLGERHERLHLESFKEYIDLSMGALDEREHKTKSEIYKKSPVIYQPLLRSRHIFDDTECEIIGQPDFLILDEGGYIIRDSKISQRITEEDHPEIFRQLQLYGWLYQRMFGQIPSRLEVHAGNNDIVDIPYDNGFSALEILKKILDLKQTPYETYNPVGWTKCNGCPFNQRCWPLAEKNLDVALVPGVDQELAIALHGEGIESINDLITKFDEKSLGEFKRPWGNRTQRVGKKAESILRNATCLAERKEILLKSPSIPEHSNYIMFDLEGLPPHLDELDKIYLWGLQIFGKDKGDYIPSVSGFGEDGDREGWGIFLLNAQTVLSRYPNIPFIHWHHYERVRIDMYIERYGDPKGIAAHVRKNLLDLLPICQNSIALPLPSYSLKVIEKYTGFKRTLDEYGGEWAMAKYIEATELEDAKAREKVMDEILKYNQEDLEATWHVLRWLNSKRK
jgi:predicted RecB family nuclease